MGRSLYRLSSAIAAAAGPGALPASTATMPVSPRTNANVDPPYPAATNTRSVRRTNRRSRDGSRARSSRVAAVSEPAMVEP